MAKAASGALTKVNDAVEIDTGGLPAANLDVLENVGITAVFEKWNGAAWSALTATNLVSGAAETGAAAGTDGEWTAGGLGAYTKVRIRCSAVAVPGTSQAEVALNLPTAAVDALLHPASKIGLFDDTLDPATGKATDASVLATSNAGRANARVQWVVATGVAATDTGAIQAAVTAMGAVNGEVRLAAGDFYVNAPITFPNDSPLRVRGSGIGKTRIFSSVDNSTVYNAALLAYSISGATTTIAGAITGGVGKTFTSTTVLAVGSWCIIGNAAGSAVYQIKARSGVSGTITYTVDRTILRTFAGGDQLIAVTAIARDITISDMTITQTGNAGLRALNFVNAVRCRVVDVAVDDSGGLTPNQGCSFDTNCLDCTYERFRILAPLAGQGMNFESSERCRMFDCSADACLIGFYVIDSYDCEIRNCSASACTSAGAKIGSALPGGGSKNVRVRGGTFSGNAGTGLVLGLGTNYKVIGVEAHNNSVTGIDVSGGETVSDISLVACRASTNGSYNVWVGATSSRTVLTDIRSASGPSIGLLVQGEAQVNGYTSVSDYYALYLAQTTGGPSTVERARIVSAVEGVTITSTIRQTIRDAEIGAGTVIDHNAASELVLDNVSTATSGGGTRGYVGITGASARLYGRCDFSSTATPVTLAGTGTYHLYDRHGTGSPEGAVIASVGSTFRRTDGGAATSFYVKESGNGNTGWAAK